MKSLSCAALITVVLVLVVAVIDGIQGRPFSSDFAKDQKSLELREQALDDLRDLERLIMTDVEPDSYLSEAVLESEPVGINFEQNQPLTALRRATAYNQKTPDVYRGGAKKRNYNLDHLARMNFRRRSSPVY